MKPTHEHADEIAELAHHARFSSKRRFRFGQKHMDQGRRPNRFMRPSAGRPPVVTEAAQALYDGFYIRLQNNGVSIKDPTYAEHFLGALIESRHVKVREAPGWRLVEKDDEGRATVEHREHGRRVVSLSTWRPDPASDEGFLEEPTYLPAAQADYVYFESEKQRKPTGDRLTRFYMNVCAPGAPRLVRSVTQNLHEADVPFTFKTTKDPLRYNRADAAVLYVARKDVPRAEDALVTIWQECEIYFGEEVPRFTKRLARGFAVAEDPGGGASFGEHRCRLTAEALWDAYLAGERTEAEREARIRAHFEANGVHPTRPYLARESDDIY